MKKEKIPYDCGGVILAPLPKDVAEMLEKEQAKKEKSKCQNPDVISVDSYTTEEIDLKFSQMSKTAAQRAFREESKKIKKRTKQLRKK